MSFWDNIRDTAKGVIIDVWTDEKVQANLDALLAKLLKDHIVPLFDSHIKPLIPIAVNMAVPIAVKAAIEQVFEKLPGLEPLAKDAIDTVAVVNDTRKELDKVIPDIDFGIPALDAVLDIWRPKRG